MAITTPIKGADDVIRAAKYIDKNYDPIYSLLWRLISTTGLRVSDAIALKWEQVDWQNESISVVESKGTKSSIARERRKECQKIKTELMGMGDVDVAVHSADVLDIINFVPEEKREWYQERIDYAIEKAPRKLRTIDIYPGLKKDLLKWHRKNHKTDEGFIFAKSSMQKSSGRPSNQLYINRQSVWRVFKEVGDYLTRTGSPVKGSCHGLRKTFAYHLHESTHDMGLVIKTMSWSSVDVANKYMGHDEASRKAAANQVFRRIAK